MKWRLLRTAIEREDDVVVVRQHARLLAERLGLSTFFFVHHQVMFLVPSLCLMLATSFLQPRDVRRAGLLVFVGGMALIGMALVFGHEVKGARRWIFGIQPSEFAKPAFVILTAWLFSEAAQRKGVPAAILGLAQAGGGLI